MKKLILASVLLFSSCSMTLPVTATSNPLGPKTGIATGTTVLGLSFGADASIASAAKAGGISRISTVDLRTRSVLGIVITRSCIVTGE